MSPRTTYVSVVDDAGVDQKAVTVVISQTPLQRCEFTAHFVAERHFRRIRINTAAGGRGSCGGRAGNSLRRFALVRYHTHVGTLLWRVHKPDGV
jgi:hypothetical protein